MAAIQRRDGRTASACLAASGGTGGGTVMIGGDTGGGNLNSITGSIPQAALSSSPVPTADTVSVDKNSTIDVSATQAGDGGKAIVWSDTKTVFAGTVLAKGGAQSGNGGFVEVSGKQMLAYGGVVNTSAVNGSYGTLLLDPYNITISSDPTSGVDQQTYQATAENSVMNVTDLVNALSNSNVWLWTGTAYSPGNQPGNITVNAAVTWNSATTLTLSAANNVAINAAITAPNGGLTVFAANSTATGAINVGTFELRSGSWVQSATNLPSFFASDFRITNGGSFLRVTGGDGTSASTAWQIADVYGLQGIGSSTTLLGQYFKLVNNIDASGTSGWNSGAGFKPDGFCDIRNAP